MSDRGVTRAFFDQWSRTYDNPFVQAVTYRPVQDAVIRAMRRQPPRLVLDVGCGTGLLTVRIGHEFGATVVGCDYSAGMLHEAARRRHDLFWVQATAAALPVGDQAVDAVVSTESFHWYPDQEGALQEFARALRVGGHAYVALINPPTRAVTVWTARWSRRLGRPLRWPTLEQMATMAHEAGFEVVAQERVARLPMSMLLPAFLNVLRRR